MLVVLNDGLAVDLSHQARSLGREIPQDLSIISYDDEIAATALPPLSAISPRRTTLGELAARQLLTHLSGGAKLSGRRTQVEPVLVLRESTAPPVRTRSPRR
ncbi:substrate-binding domain-containing protein [Microlunatus sp. Y2014]|uniref:substrate-binding domain-containing protein n=1 Tax=Microlunatus sp. Y2014 TaxID=3418488 RepID=UPI003DA73CAF